MADEQSTTTPDEVDAATNEETQDTGAELENMDVSFEDSEDTEETEEHEAENEDTDPDAQEEESDDDAEDDQAEEQEKPEVQSDEEKQKAFNKEMAERRIREKQQREQTLKQGQDKYLGEAEDNRDLAVRQLQVDAYNNKVEGNTNKLTNGYERALKDFEILADQSPEVKAEVDSAIDAFQAMHVTLDAYGNPIDVRGDLYEYLQTKAESIAKLTRMGARKQTDSKGREKSKTLTLPNRAPNQPKVDPLLEGFDEEAARY